MVPFDRLVSGYGFLLEFYSNFVPKAVVFSRFSTCKYSDLETQVPLGVTQGHL